MTQLQTNFISIFHRINCQLKCWSNSLRNHKSGKKAHYLTSRIQLIGNVCISNWKKVLYEPNICKKHVTADCSIILWKWSQPSEMQQAGHLKFIDAISFPHGNFFLATLHSSTAFLCFTNTCMIYEGMWHRKTQVCCGKCTSNLIKQSIYPCTLASWLVGIFYDFITHVSTLLSLNWKVNIIHVLQVSNYL